MEMQVADERFIVRADERKFSDELLALVRRQGLHNMPSETKKVCRTDECQKRNGPKKSNIQ